MNVELMEIDTKNPESNPVFVAPVSDRASFDDRIFRIDVPHGFTARNVGDASLDEIYNVSDRRLIEIPRTYC